MKDLTEDIIVQGYDKLAYMFGVEFLNFGIRAKDRDINRRLKLYREWGMKYV
jgi:hypothetical protein